MNKNPFSIYDFLGYLFPGIITLMLLVFIVSLNKEENAAEIEDYFRISEFSRVLAQNDLKKWESTLIAIILSYIIGHIMAYTSSVSVEYFTNRVFTYPSHYLLFAERKTTWIKMMRRFLNAKDCWRFLYCAILSALLLPVIIFIIPSTIRRFITRPLDEYVRNSIQNKLWKLSYTLHLELPDVNTDADYHRIVMHYVYLNIPNSQRKADNYVAIYGFLRTHTLIACLFFDYLLWTQISTISLSLPIHWKAVWLLLLVFFMTNILYMGFVKFYRRFTLENYMALLTEKDNNNIPQANTSTK